MDWTFERSIFVDESELAYAAACRYEKEGFGVYIHDGGERQDTMRATAFTFKILGARP